MRNFVEWQSWDLDNCTTTEILINMTSVAVLHPFWKTADEFPHRVQQIIGTLGLVVWLFAFTGNISVLRLMCR